MHFQVFVLATLLACVCSFSLIDQARLVSYLRPRRFLDTLSGSSQKHVAKSENIKRSYNQEHEIQQLDDGKILKKRYSQPAYQEEEFGHPKYNFKYTVHDVEHQDIKHHQEERDGDITVGEYSVLEPDGTILTVKYTVHADEGFNAVVSRSEV